MREGDQGEGGNGAAGWRPTPEGQLRYFDGAGWVGEAVPDPGPGPWPAGWYPHPGGPQVGEWDGQGWTGRTRPLATGHVPDSPSEDGSEVKAAAGASRRPGSRRVWVAVAAAGVVLVGALTVFLLTRGAGVNEMVGKEFATAIVTVIEDYGVEEYGAVGTQRFVEDVSFFCQGAAERVFAEGDPELGVAAGEIDVEETVRVCREETHRLAASLGG